MYNTEEPFHLNACQPDEGEMTYPVQRLTGFFPNDLTDG